MALNWTFCQMHKCLNHFIWLACFFFSICLPLSHWQFLLFFALSFICSHPSYIVLSFFHACQGHIQIFPYKHVCKRRSWWLENAMKVFSLAWCLCLIDVNDCEMRNRVADVFMISVRTAFLLFSWRKTAVCNSVANHVSFLFLSKGICSSNALKMYMTSWLAFWFWSDLFPIHLCHCTTESCSNHTDSLVFSVTRQTDLSNSHQETDTDLRRRHNECFFTSRL